MKLDVGTRSMYFKSFTHFKAQGMYSKLITLIVTMLA